MNHWTRTYFIANALVSLLLLFVAFSSAVGEPRAASNNFFYASQAGQPTLDQGEGGGNPFASALIELLSRKNLTLQMLSSELGKLTFKNSNGFQLPDTPWRIEPAKWRVQPKPASETRAALVLVFSDYASSGGAQSLPGARIDAGRVGTALTNAGFQTEIVVDPSRAELTDILRRFNKRSTSSDIVAIYATGHGVEVNGNVYLLPGDYPISEGNDALEEKGIRLSQLASAAHGKRANLIFYGGCRDNPFVK